VRKAEVLWLWIDALGVPDAIWGGVSMGAALSLWIASHAPSVARAVISISGPPFAAPESDRRWWAAHRPLVEAGRIEDYFDANVRLRMGDDGLMRLKAKPERHAELVAVLRRHSPASPLPLPD